MQLRHELKHDGKPEFTDKDKKNGMGEKHRENK